jgi:hypothetical protein
MHYEEFVCRFETFPPNWKALYNHVIVLQRRARREQAEASQQTEGDKQPEEFFPDWIEQPNLPETTICPYSTATSELAHFDTDTDTDTEHHEPNPPLTIRTHVATFSARPGRRIARESG